MCVVPMESMGSFNQRDIKQEAGLLKLTLELGNR